ncbi:MAG TPA: aldo/keto reductase [Gammaproteobacteria bacterium]|nr:aldo/keto reductase [Gammaproteobacteria bacterium]
MMPKIQLGSSGLEIARVGLGTVKFGRNQGVKYPAPFELPTDREIQALLSHAETLGINLLDTAPAYGTSEERLGKLLSHRHHWILCTKVGEDYINGQSHFDFSAKAIQQSVERSLRRLKTDYLDIVLVHSDGDDVRLIKEEMVFETLAKLKQKGMLRAYGMSTKTVDGGMLAVDHSDVVMVTHNLLYTDEQSVIAYASQKQKGVLIKKAFASGHLEKMPGSDPVMASLKFIFSEKGVSGVITGTLQKTHLEHTVRCATTFFS